jgi:hypothetical protein
VVPRLCGPAVTGAAAHAGVCWPQQPDAGIQGSAAATSRSSLNKRMQNMGCIEFTNLCFARVPHHSGCQCGCQHRP